MEFLAILLLIIGAGAFILFFLYQYEGFRCLKCGKFATEMKTVDKIKTNITPKTKSGDKDLRYSDITDVTNKYKHTCQCGYIYHTYGTFFYRNYDGRRKVRLSRSDHPDLYKRRKKEQIFEGKNVLRKIRYTKKGECKECGKNIVNYSIKKLQTDCDCDFCECKNCENCRDIKALYFFGIDKFSY